MALETTAKDASAARALIPMTSSIASGSPETARRMVSARYARAERSSSTISASRNCTRGISAKAAPAACSYFLAETCVVAIWKAAAAMPRDTEAAPI